APFTGDDVGQVLQRVQKGDFPPPRQVKQDVSPALDSICGKAMALEPRDRYPSVRALADDIEHWLADEPVAAYAEPARVRIRRWVARHRTLVSGAVAAVLVAAVCLGTSTALLTAANQREHAARLLAQENGVKAAQQRDSAWERFQMARA